MDPIPYLKSEYLRKVFDFGLLHMEVNTPLFILVLVLIVMLALNFLLFRPVLRTLDNRKALAETQHGAAEGAASEIARLAGQYEADLVDVRREVAQVRQEGHQSAQAESSRILSQAREAAQGDFEAAMTELRQQTEEARAELEASAAGLAGQISQRLVNG